jgi:hypothetical protein
MSRRSKRPRDVAAAPAAPGSVQNPNRLGALPLNAARADTVAPQPLQHEPGTIAPPASPLPANPNLAGSVPRRSADAIERAGQPTQATPAAVAPEGPRHAAKRAPEKAKRAGKERRKAEAPAPVAVPDARAGGESEERPRPWLFRRPPPVPRSGKVEIHGKVRTVASPPPRPTMWGRRYAVVYDVEGPRIRMAILWALLVAGALKVGPAGLTPLMALAAGLAGYQSARAWRTLGSKANPWVAALGAMAMTGCAAFGIRLLGIAVLALVFVALVVGVFDARRRSPVFEAAGTTVQCAVFVGLAAACVVLTLRLDISAVITLLVLVASYEIGDFIVGSGASSSLEGPFSGMLAMAIACGVMAVLRLPPFHGTTVWVFGGFVAVLAPLGQIMASAILPRADSRARALRRLDSLLIAAPVWVFIMGLYLAHLANS